MKLVPLAGFETLPTAHAWVNYFDYRVLGALMVLDEDKVVMVDAVERDGARIVVTVLELTGRRVTIPPEELHERLMFWKPEHGYYNSPAGLLKVEATDVGRGYQQGIRTNYLRIRGVETQIELRESFRSLCQMVFDNISTFSTITEARESDNFVAITRHIIGNARGAIVMGERSITNWDAAMADEDIITDIEFERGDIPCLV